jgi:hypothetical protein
MTQYDQDAIFPVAEVRRFLESGPVVQLSPACSGENTGRYRRLFKPEML